MKNFYQVSALETYMTLWQTGGEDSSDMYRASRRTSRPASQVIDWTPEGGNRRWGRPKRTWQDTCREDLQEMGVSGSDTHEARSIASDRALQSSNWTSDLFSTYSYIFNVN